jgi:OOP family OmpA-OmpF porin
MTRQRRFQYLTIASLSLTVVACGGATQFAGAQPFSIAGTPPPPPAPPPPPPVAEPEPPKPEPRVELRDNKIQFKEKIQFEVNKAVIKEESFSLLHEIAEVIQKNSQVKKISIEGHASAEGDAKKNKKLSDDRAKSVMDHLIKKESVDTARLVAKGWGIEKPIAGNDTEEGREKNRRVEFLVVEQDVTKKKVEIDPTTGKERVVDEKVESFKAPESTDVAAAKPDAKPKAGDAKPKAGDAKPKADDAKTKGGDAKPKAGDAKPKADDTKTDAPQNKEDR